MTGGYIKSCTVLICVTFFQQLIFVRSAPINGHQVPPSNSWPYRTWNRYHTQVQSYVPLNIRIPRPNGQWPSFASSSGSYQQPHQNVWNRVQQVSNQGLFNLQQYTGLSLTTESPNLGGAVSIRGKPQKCQSGCYYDNYIRQCRCQNYNQLMKFSDY